jgi:acyl-coenzyme A synthetase/AMP-(fatty) acid ligase
MEKRYHAKRLLLGDDFKKWARVSPNREFLIDWVTGDGKRRLSYKETAEEVYKLCWALKDRGIKKGDMVATLSYGSVEQTLVCIGATLIGYVIGPQNPDLPDDWLVTIINDRMAAKFVFFDDVYREKVIRLMPRLKSVKYYISLDGPSDEGKGIINYRDMVSKYEPKEVMVEAEEGDIGELCMSGGTTGCPKAAMWTQEAMWWSGYSFCMLADGGPGIVFADLSPPFWSTILCVDLWPALMSGGTRVILNGRFGEAGYTEKSCEAVTKEKMNYGLFPAFMFMEIASWSDEKASKYDLSSLHHGIPWGITVPLAMCKKMYDRWGIVGPRGSSACEYGVGTRVPASTIERSLLKGEEKKLAGWGLPAPFAEVKVVDSEGRDVPSGEMGEMVLTQPDMFCGYLEQPEKTAQALKEGWLYTGNLVSMDDEGYIFLEAKKEDAGRFPVDREGKFVLPYEMQMKVTGIEGIVEASFVTVADPEYKAKYRLIVRSVEGVEVPEEKIKEAASEAIPSYLIEDVVFRKEPIPKTATGKILLTTLAEEYGGVIPEE